MSLLPEIRSRPSLPYDGLVGREPPLKRSRSFLGGHPIAAPVGEEGYGVGAARGYGYSSVGSEPFSSSVYGRAFTDDAYQGSVEARAWPLGLGMEEKMPSAPTPATAFIDRYLSKPEPLQVPDIGLGFAQNETHAAIGLRTEIQAPSLTIHAKSRSKTKLCKHFISGDCKFKESCNFAHSIDELKRLPSEADGAGKALLQMYRFKAEAEKLPLGLEKIQTDVTTDFHASAPAIPTESKTKLCKHFIAGDCKFKENCNFAHSIEELKKLPAEGDDAGKDLLERYRSKAEAEKLSSGLEQIQTHVTTEPHTSTSNIPTESKLKGKQNLFRPMKTKLCKHFLSGACKYKENCTFAHSAEELNSPAEGKDVVTMALPAVSTTSPSTKTVTILPVVVSGLTNDHKVEEVHEAEDKKAGLLKTRLCKHFQAGLCAYKDKCNFSHGLEELRKISDKGATSLTAITSTELHATLPAQTVLLPDGKKAEGATKGAGSKNDDGKKGEVATKGAGSKNDLQGLQKTKPCKFFLEGTCRFGETCNFLHRNGEMHVSDGNGGSSQPGVPDGPPVLKATYKTRLCTKWEKGEPCAFGSKCHFAHGIEELRHGAGLSIPGTDNSVQVFELEARSGSKEVFYSSILPYSYEITDTNWRPFLTAEEAWNGSGRDLGSINGRVLDVEVSDARHWRGWNQSYGPLEQASSWTNPGLTSNVFANLPYMSDKVGRL